MDYEANKKFQQTMLLISGSFVLFLAVMLTVYETLMFYIAYHGGCFRGR